MTPCWEKSSSGLRLRTEHSLTKEGEDSAALIYEDKTKIEANWESLVVTDDNEELIASAQRALAQVITTHGIGYGEEVTRKLLMGSRRSQSLSADVRPVAKDTFRGCKLCDSPLD